MDGIMLLLFPQLFSLWEYCNFSASFTIPAISQQSFLRQIDVLFSWFCIFGFLFGFCVVFSSLEKLFFFPVDQSEDFWPFLLKGKWSEKSEEVFSHTSIMKYQQRTLYAKNIK